MQEGPISGQRVYSAGKVANYLGQTYRADGKSSMRHFPCTTYQVALILEPTCRGPAKSANFFPDNPTHLSPMQLMWMCASCKPGNTIAPSRSMISLPTLRNQFGVTGSYRASLIHYDMCGTSTTSLLIVGSMSDRSTCSSTPFYPVSPPKRSITPRTQSHGALETESLQLTASRSIITVCTTALTHDVLGGRWAQTPRGCLLSVHLCM